MLSVARIKSSRLRCISLSLFEERRRRQSAESEKKFKSKRFTFPGRKKFLKRKDDSLPHSVSLSHTHTRTKVRAPSLLPISISLSQKTTTRARTRCLFLYRRLFSTTSFQKMNFVYLGFHSRRLSVSRRADFTLNARARIKKESTTRKSTQTDTHLRINK